MRGRLLLAGSLLLGACGEANLRTEGQRHFELGQEMLRVRLSMDPCVRWEADIIHSRRLRDCLEFLPQERMRGVWIFGLEESGFLPGATTAPAERTLTRGSHFPEWDFFVELDFEQVLRTLEALPATTRSRAFAIEFIGRRSRDTTTAINGEATRVIVVDRMLSSRYLGDIVTHVDLPGLNAQPLQPAR
jgi:hypothetical protein